MSATGLFEVLPPDFGFLNALAGQSQKTIEDAMGMYMAGYRQYCATVKIVSRNASSDNSSSRVREWVRQPRSNPLLARSLSPVSVPSVASGLASRVSTSSSASVAIPAGECWRKFLKPDAGLRAWPALSEVLATSSRLLRSDVSLTDFTVNRTEAGKIHVLRGGRGPLLSDALALAVGSRVFPSGSLGASLAGTSSRTDLPPLDLSVQMGGRRVEFRMRTGWLLTKAEFRARREALEGLLRGSGLQIQLEWDDDASAIADLTDCEWDSLGTCMRLAGWDGGTTESGLAWFRWTPDS